MFSEVSKTHKQTNYIPNRLLNQPQSVARRTKTKNKVIARLLWTLNRKPRSRPLAIEFLKQSSEKKRFIVTSNNN